MPVWIYIPGNLSNISLAQATSTTSLSFSAWLLLSWLAVIISLSGVVLFRFISLQRKMMQLPLVARKDLVEKVAYHATEMGISRPVRLVCCRLSPSTIGFWRPMIILPPEMVETWSWQKIEPIVLHELAHIKRSDFLFNWVQIAVQIVYFFHPGVWYTNRKIRQEREYLCDDFAFSQMRTTSSPKPYVQTILYVYQSCRNHSLPASVTTSFSSQKIHFIKRRIQRMLTSNYSSPASKWIYFGLIFFLTFSVVICAQDSKEEVKAPAPVVVNDATITLDVKDADIRDVINQIAEIARVNVVISREVKGKVTSKLKDVPWLVALNAVAESNRYHVLKVRRNVWQVDELKSISLEVNDIPVQRVVAMIENISSYPIQVEKGISDKITMKLDNLPWLTALEIMAYKYNYQIQQEERRILITRKRDRKSIIVEEGTTIYKSD